MRMSPCQWQLLALFDSSATYCLNGIYSACAAAACSYVVNICVQTYLHVNPASEVYCVYIYLICWRLFFSPLYSHPCRILFGAIHMHGREHAVPSLSLSGKSCFHTCVSCSLARGTFPCQSICLLVCSISACYVVCAPTGCVCPYACFVNPSSYLCVCSCVNDSFLVCLSASNCLPSPPNICTLVVPCALPKVQLPATHSSLRIYQRVWTCNPIGIWSPTCPFESAFHVHILLSLHMLILLKDRLLTYVNCSVHMRILLSDWLSSSVFDSLHLPFTFH